MGRNRGQIHHDIKFTLRQQFINIGISPGNPELFHEQPYPLRLQVTAGHHLDPLVPIKIQMCIRDSVRPSGFPGVHGAQKAIFLCLCIGPAQGMVPVFQQSFSSAGVCKHKVGQDENLRIPEGVALIAFSAHSFCTDSNPAVVRLSHNSQMVQCETQGQLVKTVFTGDFDIPWFPIKSPGLPALFEEPVIPFLSGSTEN